MRWAVFLVALLPGARRGAICLSHALRRGADGLESSDASLMPIERSVWSDRGVGHSLFFLAGFQADFQSAAFAALNALIAASLLLWDRFRGRR